MRDLNAPAEFSANPYIGPRAFTRDVQRQFFGREREARDLHDLLVFSDLVLFYAQSGAGKSSLINASVIPMLQKEGGFEILPIGRIGGELPAGIEAVDNIYAFNLVTSLKKRVEDPSRLAHTGLVDFLSQLETGDELTFPDAGEVPHRVLIIDQFEEIFTAHPERWGERKEFFFQLGEAIKDDPYLHILLIMREDYVAALDPYAPLVPDRLRTRFYMERMGVAAALEAIHRPAELGGRPFAPGVAEKLVDDLRQIRVLGQAGTVPGEYVEPVQLQVVCYQLWESLRGRPPGPITLVDLEDVGNVDRSLLSLYEGVLANTGAATSVSEAQLRTWFERQLITEAGTRGLVFRGETETGGLPNSAVDQLARQFLIRTELRAGGVWVELANDRFIELIRRSNAAWRSRDPLTSMARAWQASGRMAAMLLSQDQLTQVASGDQGRWDPDVAEYIRASRERHLASRETAAREN